MTNAHDKWESYIEAQKQRKREKKAAKIRARKSEAKLRKLKELAEKTPS